MCKPVLYSKKFNSKTCYKLPEEPIRKIFQSLPIKAHPKKSFEWNVATNWNSCFKLLS